MLEFSKRSKFLSFYLNVKHYQSIELNLTLVVNFMCSFCTNILSVKKVTKPNCNSVVKNILEAEGSVEI